MTKVLTVRSGSSEELRLEGGETIEAEAIDFNALGGVGNFVWIQGIDPTIAAPNVFGRWDGPTGLYQALKGFSGQSIVTVNNFIADAEVPAGEWPLITDVTFIAGAGFPVQAIILFDDGAHFPSTENITFDGCIPTCISAIMTRGSGITVCNLQNNSKVTGGVFVSVHGTAAFISHVDESVWDTGTIETTAAGAVAAFEVINVSTFAANAVAATSTAGVVQVLYDLSSAENVFQTQPAGPTYGFTPADLANVKQAAGNTGTGASAVHASTAAITAVWSKKIAVSGIATGVISANGTITVSLVRDLGTGGAATIASLPALTILADTAFAIPIQFVDTAPDSAGHTYSVVATADGAHTIATGANGCQVQANELT